MLLEISALQIKIIPIAFHFFYSKGFLSLFTAGFGNLKEFLWSIRSSCYDYSMSSSSFLKFKYHIGINMYSADGSSDLDEGTGS